MNVVLLGSNTKEEIENNLRIVASAGALSRSEGTVMDVYESKNDYQKNLRLAKAVVGYGHRSISEHDYLVFALEDVTPVIEQTIIEYRLTSFTIKSRRNVDFRNVGFYVPDFKTVKGDRLDSRELKLDYNNYMKSLFTKYGELVDEGLPIEDCRYILPYSYHSNIIMGCDANELFRITSDLLYGKMAKIDEAKELGAKLANMMGEACPYLVSSLKKEEKKDYYNEVRIIKIAISVFMKENERRAGRIIEEDSSLYNQVMQALETNESIRYEDGKWAFVQYDVMEYITRLEKAQKLYKKSQEQSKL